MRTPRPLNFSRSSIPTCPGCSRKILLSPLECALPDKHRVLPVFSRNRPQLNPLEATLTRMPTSVHSKGFTGDLSLLDATLTKNIGGRGAHPSSQRLFSLVSRFFHLLRLSRYSSHSGTHPFASPEKAAPFFSCTYRSPFATLLLSISCGGNNIHDTQAY
jgi:hypothetical protein